MGPGIIKIGGRGGVDDTGSQRHGTMTWPQVKPPIVNTFSQTFSLKYFVAQALEGGG